MPRICRLGLILELSLLYRILICLFWIDLVKHHFESVLVFSSRRFILHCEPFSHVNLKQIIDCVFLIESLRDLINLAFSQIKFVICTHLCLHHWKALSQFCQILQGITTLTSRRRLFAGNMWLFFVYTRIKSLIEVWIWSLGHRTRLIVKWFALYRNFLYFNRTIAVNTTTYIFKLAALMFTFRLVLRLLFLLLHFS